MQDVNEEVEFPVQAHGGSSDDEEGQVKDDDQLGKKRRRPPSIEEQPSLKKVKPTEEVGISSFGHMQQPYSEVPCVVSVNEDQPFGSLYQQSTGFAILLFMDPGRYGPPTVALGFRPNGTGAKTDKARSIWDVRSNIMREWAMSDVEHGYATPDANDPRMSNPSVLALCTPKDMGELLYMRFKSWPQGAGFYDKPAFDGQSGEIKRFLSAIFQPKKPYSLEIWFVAPSKAIDFRKHCLRYFSEAVNNRIDPLEGYQDSLGNYFNERLIEPPPSILVRSSYRNQLLRVPEASATLQRGLQTERAPRRGQTSAAQDIATGNRSVSRRPEQNEGRPQTTQHVEDSKPTAARDITMLDRTRSPSPETPQNT